MLIFCLFVPTWGLWELLQGEQASRKHKKSKKKKLSKKENNNICEGYGFAYMLLYETRDPPTWA